MRNFSETVINMTDRIASADCAIIYGAKKRAEQFIPVCEAFADMDKIKIAVTNKEGKARGIF